MAVGTLLEPLAVVGLLFGGAWINRVTYFSLSTQRSKWQDNDSVEGANAALQSRQTVGEMTNKRRSLLPSTPPSHASSWRERDLKFPGLQHRVAGPNTAVFQNRLLSRLLRKSPLLVECWYWALIYGSATKILSVLHCTIKNRHRSISLAML
jgi:hypothetical protein